METLRLLEGNDQKNCSEMLYGILSNFIDSIPDTIEKQESKDFLSVIDFVNKKLDDFTIQQNKCIKRHSNIHYFYGMICGFGVIGLVAVVIGGILKIFNVAQTTFFGIVGSVIVGGIGSFVSVLSRMSTGNLELDIDSGPSEITRVGVFRPIIGSIMGVIIYSLMLSSIIPVAIPQDPSTQLYFFIVVAFLAGFAERWAQDMLDLARGRITDKAREDAERKKFEEETRKKLETELSEKLEAERKKIEEEINKKPNK